MIADISASTLVLLVCAALFAGMVDAIGGGGGLVTLPALLAAGLPPHLALGTNKGQSMFGSGAALARYAHADLLRGRAVAGEFAAGFAGSLAGASLVLLLPPRLLQPLVIVLLLAAAAVLVLPRPGAGNAGAHLRPQRTGLAVAIALVLGTYDGFFGPGTGTFLIIASVTLLGASFQQASADAKVVNFASNLGSAALFASRGAVLWSIALPMALGQLVGGLLGAHLVVRGGDRVVRVVSLLVVAALVAKLTLDLVSG